MDVIIDSKIEKAIKFIIEVDKLKAVTRKVKPLHVPERYENSAEHSWQIALLALTLSSYAGDGVDIHRAIEMLLVHDIGEIDTGDTMFFADGDWGQRKKDELRAVRRICSLLDKETSSYYVGLWQEFEAAETPEAIFANAIDRVMPVLLNINNNGQSWKENGITYDKVLSKVRPPIEKGFPLLWEYIEDKLKEANKNRLFA